MLARNALQSSMVLVLIVCGACGGTMKPAPLAADNSDPPESSDAGTSEPSTATVPSTSDGAGGAAGLVACVASDSVCAETGVSDAEAADAKDRCKGAKGEPHDGECTHDNISATCAVESKKLTLYYYKGANAKATRSLLKSAAGSCKTLGGTFTPTGKPAGGGGGKKKPKGK